MVIHHALQRSAVCIGVALLVYGDTSFAEPTDQPNILFFLVDDTGVADTSEPFLYNPEGEPIDAPP